jgi:KRAB domain-containing zinc finger protein
LCLPVFNQTALRYDLGTLKRYIRIHKHLHTIEKTSRYSCTMCKKLFSQSGYLKEHLRTHTGKNPHACLYCDKSFSKSDNLQKYINRFTLISFGIYTQLQERTNPFLNQIIFKYINRFTLERNLMSFGIYDKSFSYSGSLTKHQKIHTGEKLYSCAFCDKSFSRSDYLTLHQRIHTREKSYACAIYHKSFSNSVALTLHQRIHTGENPMSVDFVTKDKTNLC